MRLTRSVFAFGMKINFLRNCYCDAKNCMEKIARARIPRPCFDFAKFVNDYRFCCKNMWFFNLWIDSAGDPYPDITINGCSVYDFLKFFILICEFCRRAQKYTEVLYDLYDLFPIYQNNECYDFYLFGFNLNVIVRVLHLPNAFDGRAWRVCRSLCIV